MDQKLKVGGIVAPSEWGKDRGAHPLLKLEELSWNGNSAGDLGDAGSIPGGGHGNSLQYSCLENPHGQRSLLACSPWGYIGSAV